MKKNNAFCIKSTYTILGIIKLTRYGRPSTYSNGGNYGEFDIRLFGLVIFNKREANLS